MRPESNAACASSRRAANACTGMPPQDSMANARVKPGARFAMRIAASIISVPVPHMGSCSTMPGRQGERETSAAASVSRSGASPFHVR